MNNDFDDSERVALLASYGILDTEDDHRFDGITATVSKQFDVPVAAVSFIDADRQWFKSCLGLDVRETPREHAFCDHTMRRSLQTVFVVKDPANDPRFHDNPLVTGTTGIRFYAGSPIVTSENMPLGALCIIDRKPRPDLTRQVLHPLIIYAKRCVDLLERHRAATLKRGLVLPCAQAV